jgi:Ni/Co efflux regulator RcnB
MKRTLSCLLAAATIAAASVATTTDASAQLAGTRWRLARGMEGG